VISFFCSIIYGIIAPQIACLRITVRFAFYDFLDTFPFLREWYVAIIGGIAFVRAEIVDVSSTL